MGFAEPLTTVVAVVVGIYRAPTPPSLCSIFLEERRGKGKGRKNLRLTPFVVWSTEPDLGLCVGTLRS